MKINILDSIIEKSPLIIKSVLLKILPAFDDPIMTDTAEVKNNDLENNDETDEIKTGLTIKGAKLNQYYGDRKKLKYWLLLSRQAESMAGKFSSGSVQLNLLVFLLISLVMVQAHKA